MNSIIFFPSSCQLRLATCGEKSDFGYVRPGIYRRYARFVVLRMRCTAMNGNEIERRVGEKSSWASVNSSVDGFAGWANSPEKRSSEDYEKKKSLIGIMGAGVAGAIIFSGLTFFILSLSSRGTSRNQDPIMPLMSEKALSSANNQHQTEYLIGMDEVVPVSSGNEERDTSSDNDRLLYRENFPFCESRMDDDVRQPFEDGSDLVLKSNQGESSQTSQNFIGSTSSNDQEYLISARPNGASNMNADTEVKNDITVTESIPVLLESGSTPLVSDIEESKESVNSAVSSKDSVNSVVSGEVEEYAYKPREISHGNNSNGLGVFSPDSGPTSLGITSPSVGIPAPAVVPATSEMQLGKILVLATVDELQSQALSALKTLKVIEEDAKPGDLCTRREYARWLVTASSVLSRSVSSKVYPAMYIDDVSEIAYDDVAPEEPDFQSIQGLAEAGLIASKLSRSDLQQTENEDTSPFYFYPERPLSRQDLVTWRMALDKKQLPLVDRTTLKQVSGFIDIDKIDPDAWPALVADIAAGEQSIVTLAFGDIPYHDLVFSVYFRFRDRLHSIVTPGYTRLFQPGKPVTKAQAAITLSTGDAYAVVSEELARIEAESMAENAVASHSALVTQVENELNESYEKALILEREKINAVGKLAEEAKQEVEKLRAIREEENLAIMKERAAVDSEMEILSRLRREVEEQLQAVMADKLEISYEKERLNKLRRESEAENQEITKLQNELEIERKALSLAREWAEEEAKRAREQAKALDEARNLWKNQGIKVVVDKDLEDETEAEVTWLGSDQHFSVEETVKRAESIAIKIKRMTSEVGGRIKNTLSRIVEILVLFVSNLKKRVEEMREGAKSRWDSTSQCLHDDSTAFISGIKQSAHRITGECKQGFERLSQKFKT